jgi:hypothetical protein
VRSALVVIAALGVCAFAADLAGIIVTAPRDGSHPRSAYMALTGTAAPGSRLQLQENNSTIRTVAAAEDGHFDFVVKLAPGEHELHVQDGEASASVRVTAVSGFAPPVAAAPWQDLQPGDVIFSRASESQQVSLYNPKFTHISLYAGPDPDGTPMVLEAVAERGDVPDGTVSLVALEDCLAWTADSVSIYRLRGGFRPGERDALIGWARTTAAREIPFWTLSEDFGTLFRAWMMWDRERDAPRDPAEFARLLTLLKERRNSNRRFNCATVVWRDFLDATHGRVDISEPNRASISWVTPKFMETIRPVLLIPDTIALSGKLEEITK